MPALYLHVPFCRRKCPYCDFFSVAAESPHLADYPQLLVRHLRVASKTWSGPFTSVFFGGGTPSLLPPADVATILSAVRDHFGFTGEAEITLEANPGTITLESLAGYRSAGVNRLSLGIQSLQAKNLHLLGRIHSPEAARQAVAWARRAGFDNLSCDLMFALPGQFPGDLRSEIIDFLALGPDHLSCYGLTMEEGTPFHHQHRSGGLSLPDEEMFRRLYLALHEQLAEAGFRHYEISNFARPGCECRHNLHYWRRRPYLGIGAGAHSFCGRGWGKRLAVPPELEGYTALLRKNADPAETLEIFDRRGAMAETMYLGLRTAEGVSEDDFRSRFGRGVAELFPGAVRRLADTLEVTDGNWRLDLEGWLLYDHLIIAFL